MSDLLGQSINLVNSINPFNFSFFFSKNYLLKFDFVIQSNSMEVNWAAEHLQTIRTLMERTALYRRALAPIMTFNGAVGAGAAIVGLTFKIDVPSTFILFWASVVLLAMAGSFLLVRRQALK